LNRLGGCGSGGSIFEESDQLSGVAGGGKARLAGADDGEGFACGKMGESFFEGAGEVGE